MFKFVFAMLLVWGLSFATAHELTAFRNVNVIPMEGAKAILVNQTVVVKHGIIERIGPTAKMTVPKDATVIEAKGKFLIPGLVDTAIYGLDPHALFDWTSHGITAVRHMRAAEVVQSWRPRVDHDFFLAPDLYLSWHLIASTNDRIRGPYITVDDEDDAKKVVRDHGDRGYDFIRATRDLTPTAFHALLTEANRHDFPVLGYVPKGVLVEDMGPMISLEGLDALVASSQSKDSPFRDGVPRSDGVRAYGFIDEAAFARNAALLARRGVVVSLSLTGLMSARADEAQTRAFLARPEWRFVGPEYQRFFDPLRNAEQSEAERADLAQAKVRLPRLLELLRDAKVPIAIGSAATRGLHLSGFDYGRELNLLVEMGFTPAQALRAATVNGARALNASRTLGTVVEGKRANLVLLNGNPLERIEHAGDLAGVLLRGRWLPRAELERRRAERAVFFEREIELLKRIREQGAAPLLAEYKAAREKDPDLQWFREWTLVRVGYNYLYRSKDLERATGVFELMAASYPDLFNSYDCLGEAHLVAGRLDLAKSNYEKCLELRPGFQNALEKLAEINAAATNSAKGKESRP
ncbi:Amidohydrolase family protein [Sulfidibacter corallicola]|uniref:Amidohydrolase family protein n=1 Tax=Sulfidibacter corallicola TaxID=2818388 RepID=A0A8A4TPG8_SULCO|nr:amidohydrolase family protein [Sulfidibacter corallicola]QTD48475.1 amidohydrolase family protein [Sulfidibacter corallicola]